MKEIGKSLWHVAIIIFIALCFNAGIYFIYGQEKALEFLAGYLIEFSLSIDNMFVFLTIFMSFGIPEHAQHKVLGWGILGAIVLRFFFIFFGIQLVTSFEWLLYIFGGILIISGIKMMVGKEEEKDPRDSKVIKLLGKVMPMTDSFHGEKFFIRQNAKLFATPLFAVVLIVESSDILFAIDSVPAVLSVSTDLLIVYASNIFAILGLRQLFFVLEHLQERFQYVKYGVALILMFTGVKMLSGVLNYHISTVVSISVILVILVLSIVISMIVSGKQAKENEKDN